MSISHRPYTFSLLGKEHPDIFEIINGPDARSYYYYIYIITHYITTAICQHWYLRSPIFVSRTFDISKKTFCWCTYLHKNLSVTMFIWLFTKLMSVLEYL